MNIRLQQRPPPPLVSPLPRGRRPCWRPGSIRRAKQGSALRHWQRAAPQKARGGGGLLCVGFLLLALDGCASDDLGRIDFAGAVLALGLLASCPIEPAAVGGLLAGRGHLLGRLLLARLCLLLSSSLATVSLVAEKSRERRELDSCCWKGAVSLGLVHLALLGLAVLVLLLSLALLGRLVGQGIEGRSHRCRWRVRRAAALVTLVRLLAPVTVGLCYIGSRRLGG
mmetsp:Transcript_29542/g.85484  ORF Transcript_29542/g.85484 Transcript_29542/m.85484 type:complete len:225 (+) Transcript_29542:1966-2640(+)